jgi:hypothetical protein
MVNVSAATVASATAQQIAKTFLVGKHRINLHDRHPVPPI